jgi:hypothetical protein
VRAETGLKARAALRCDIREIRRIFNYVRKENHFSSGTFNVHDMGRSSISSRRSSAGRGRIQFDRASTGDGDPAARRSDTTGRNGYPTSGHSYATRRDGYASSRNSYATGRPGYAASPTTNSWDCTADDESRRD